MDNAAAQPIGIPGAWELIENLRTFWGLPLAKVDLLGLAKFDLLGLADRKCIISIQHLPPRQKIWKQYKIQLLETDESRP